MSELKVIAIGLIDPDPQQPRKHFDQGELMELAGSIEAFGILQPIIVRPSQSERFTIIAGERRWRAAQVARLAEVPCFVRTEDSELAITELRLVENLHRTDLNPIEIARALGAMMSTLKLSVRQVAIALKKSDSWVSHHLALLDVPECWQSAMCYPDRSGKVAPEAAIRELQRLKILDKIATTKPKDARLWSEAYGRSCLHGSASDAPRRSHADCRRWVDRVLAWLDWSIREIPVSDSNQDGTSTAVFRSDCGAEQSDWMYASYLFDSIRPDANKLTEADRQKLKEAAGRVDFKADPFIPDWCNAPIGNVI